MSAGFVSGIMAGIVPGFIIGAWACFREYAHGFTDGKKAYQDYTNRRKRGKA
jgi:hypothetical protein